MSAEHQKLMHGKLLGLLEECGKAGLSHLEAVGILLGTACAIASETGITKDQVVAEVAKCFEVVR